MSGEYFAHNAMMPRSVRAPSPELNYEWHRWYNTQTGQWLTQDPLGLQAGPSGCNQIFWGSLGIAALAGYSVQSCSITWKTAIRPGFLRKRHPTAVHSHPKKTWVHPPLPAV